MWYLMSLKNGGNYEIECTEEDIEKLENVIDDKEINYIETIKGD